jgi:hypothetical protein
MNFTNQELEVLRELGFHASRKKRSDPRPIEERGWSRRFGEGPVTALLHVRKSVVGFEYRVVVSNQEQKEDEVQWFGADELRRTRRALGQLVPVWKKARRALEGGPARRALNRLMTRK